LVKKENIKFNLSAVIYLMLAAPKIQQAVKDEGYNFEKRLMILHAESGTINQRAKTVLRKIFNDIIVKSNNYKKRYTQLLLKLADESNKKTNEFSIEIKGAASKDEIVRSLHEIVSSIEAYTINELRDGKTWEDSSLITTTNLPEKYY
jgi:hypothetical protein